MGINYSDIHTIKKGNNSDFLRTQLYRENTHVFAYYILTSIFMNNYPDFLVWCNKYNTSLLSFNKSDSNFKEFTKFIEDNYDIPMQNPIIYLGNLNDYIYSNNNNNKLVKSTRMSIIEPI